MIDTYIFKPGDWIIVEDAFAVVDSIFPTYYEPFDATDEDIKIGDYKHTVISYHTFCNLNGRVLSSKAQIKYLDFCEWIRAMTEDQRVLFESIKVKKSVAFAKWEEKCKDATDYVSIDVPTEKGKASEALSKFRKAIKQLPDRFTYSDLQTMLDSIPELEVSTTANSNSCDKDYISFELCYILKEQKGKCLSFYKIRNFDCTEDLSSFMNFEGVFISLYQLVVLYNKERNSEELTALAAKLKKTFFALVNREFKDNPLAKDFHKNAPKVNYSAELAYSTITDFLTRNADVLGAKDFIESARERDTEILNLYGRLLDVEN